MSGDPRHADRQRRELVGRTGGGQAFASAVLVAAMVLGLFAPASAQETGARGVQFEAAGLVTTLMGGAFPHDEAGFGGTFGARYRWPNGLSLGLLGFHAQPEDLDLPSTDPRRTMSQWGVFGEARYHLTRLTPLRPYLGARVGWTRLDDEADPGVAGDGVSYGLVTGVEFWPHEQVVGRAGVTAGGMSVSGFFGPEESTSATSWTLEAGVSVFLGEVSRDADGDGVRDRDDACPETPGGVPVDKGGCARDADGDGVPDYRDACPQSPTGARVDDRGCPVDGDSDGVYDGLDACPGTSEDVPVDDEGCVLDSDDDGVHDGRDACPDTPPGVEVNERGCIEDSDDDGVADAADACPGTQYRDEVDEEGCSRVQRSMRESGRFTLPGLPLDLDALRLRGPSRNILEDVGQQLADRPGAVLEVRVFTDREGTPAYNRRVSQTLAEALKDHLLSSHPSVEEDRVRAIGYGERLGPEEGEEGGSQRRPRVDFVFVQADDAPRGGPR